MPTSRRLQRLFQAISVRDWNAAEQVAKSICLEEEKKGHRKSATQLRGALAPNARRDLTQSLNPSNALNFPMFAAMSRIDRDVSLEEVVLSAKQRESIWTVVAEWMNESELLQRGVHLRRKLLFHGPPGCGKTLSAIAIANALKMPVYVVRFDAIVGAFLGQTAVNLRQVFHFAETQRCVLLLDELDALGRRRGNPLDVGELDRVVISLMQELDHSGLAGMVIATTNLPAQLDDALWRRFDLVVGFPRPSQRQLATYVNAVAQEKGMRTSQQFRRIARQAKSFAEAERLMNDETRRQVLATLRGKNGKV